MSSNYPDDVSGNEPQITGIWPPETVLTNAIEDLQSAKAQAIDEINRGIGVCEDQGMNFNTIEVRHQEKMESAIEEAFDNVIDDLQARMPEDY